MNKASSFCPPNQLNDNLMWKRAKYRGNIVGICALKSKGRADDFDIVAIEKEVEASTRADLDFKRVAQALDTRTPPSEDPGRVALLAEPWKISVAAATAISTLVFVTTNNYIVALVSLFAVFFVANGDPTDEEGAFGSFARLLGRLTINSVESSKPKLRALARAAVTDEEEIVDLQRQVKELKEENEVLALWKLRRIAVDESLSRYTLSELKEKARQNNISVGGNKSQLLMRLVEAEVISL